RHAGWKVTLANGLVMITSGRETNPVRGAYASVTTAPVSPMLDPGELRFSDQVAACPATPPCSDRENIALTCTCSPNRVSMSTADTRFGAAPPPASSRYATRRSE